jgi:hypothetical protein
MAFGEASDADAEAARIGMGAGVIKLLNKADEIGGVLEVVVFMAVVFEVARGIASEGEDVRDAGLGVAFEDVVDIFFLMADAGEVGAGIEGV